MVALRMPPNPCTRTTSLGGSRASVPADQEVTTATQRWWV